MPNAAEKYRDWWLRQQHSLRRVENGVGRELIGNLSTAKLEIQAQLETAENTFTGLDRDARLVRLNNLIEDIDVVMAEANRLNTELLTQRLNEIGMTQADLVGDRVQGMFTGTDIVINRLPIEQVFAMVEQPLGGLQFAERMAKNYGDAVYNMKAALTQSVIQGEDMAQAGRRLLGRGAVIAGLEGKKLKDRMDMIARTEIQRVSNEAARAVYDANTDVIKGLQYVATLDRRTCLLEDSNVLTKTGWKRISNVSVGERVRTHAGRYKPIQAKFKQKRKKYLRIKLSNGKTLKVTPDHEVLVGGNWVEIGILRKGDFIDGVST